MRGAAGRGGGCGDRGWRGPAIATVTAAGTSPSPPSREAVSAATHASDRWLGSPLVRVAVTASIRDLPRIPARTQRLRWSHSPRRARGSPLQPLPDRQLARQPLTDGGARTTGPRHARSSRPWPWRRGGGGSGPVIASTTAAGLHDRPPSREAVSAATCALDRWLGSPLVPVVVTASIRDQRRVPARRRGADGPACRGGPEDRRGRRTLIDNRRGDRPVMVVAAPPVPAMRAAASRGRGDGDGGGGGPGIATVTAASAAG